MKSHKRPFSDSCKSKYFKKSKSISTVSALKLKDEFYDQECITLAKSLLGQFIVRKNGELLMKCRIVEVESYLTKDDKASHSYNNKETKRNKSMFMKPGTLYVYMTYGMYCCMNISSAGPGSAVLIRAAQPVEGIEEMLENRNKKQKNNKTVAKSNISNGPSKLCQALAIDRNLDQTDLTTSDLMWLEKSDRISDQFIVCCPRIGLGKKCGEWRDAMLRFYISGSEYVSVRNKKAEAEMVA